MNPWSFYLTYRRGMAAQWLERDALRAIQDRSLRKLVRRAYLNVPYYRKLLDEAGVSPDAFTGRADLHRIPITNKSDLQNLPLDVVLDRTVVPSRLISLLSSGSTGQPFATYHDQAALQIRSSLFLRALRSTGYRFGHKVLLVKAAIPQRFGQTIKPISALSLPHSRALLRWHYASVEEPPEKLLKIFMQVSPDYLYGCVTVLKLLAETVADISLAKFKLAGVITKSETLTRSTRRLLEHTFKCDVFDFYGSIEMGTVAWECCEHEGYHLADDAVIVEQMPLSEKGGISRLIMTNLYSTAMPFLRYDTGDTGLIDGDVMCKCGRTLSLLRRLDGRTFDCIRLPDGRLISPYLLEDHIEVVRGVKRWQVIQHDLTSVVVRVEPGRLGSQVSYDDVRAAVRKAIGDEMSVDIQITDKLPVDPKKKFRPVTSLLGRQYDA